MPNCKETKGRGFAAPSEPEAPPTFRVRAFHLILDYVAFILDDVPPIISVNIDIKPGSFPNSINLKSKGLIAVAILTTSTAQGEPLDFGATTVDAISVQFGPNGAIEAHGVRHLEDVDGDGDLDLVLHFRTQETGISCGDTSASLTGQTFGGQAIQGSDSIRTVGCK